MVNQNLFNVEEGPPVKQIRELLGMNQQQFATLLGVATSTVSRWENGKSSPQFTPGQFKLLLKLLRPHGVRLKDLPDDLGLAGQS